MRLFAEEFDKASAEELEKAKEGDAGKGQQACDEDKTNAEYLKKAEDDKKAREEKKATDEKNTAEAMRWAEELEKAVLEGLEKEAGEKKTADSMRRDTSPAARSPTTRGAAASNPCPRLSDADLALATAVTEGNAAKEDQTSKTEKKNEDDHKAEGANNGRGG